MLSMYTLGEQLAIRSEVALIIALSGWRGNQVLKHARLGIRWVTSVYCSLIGAGRSSRSTTSLRI